jgi:hypothetical protein
MTFRQGFTTSGSVPPPAAIFAAKAWQATSAAMADGQLGGGAGPGPRRHGDARGQQQPRHIHVCCGVQNIDPPSSGLQGNARTSLRTQEVQEAMRRQRQGQRLQPLPRQRLVLRGSQRTRSRSVWAAACCRIIAQHPGLRASHPDPLPAHRSLGLLSLNRPQITAGPV